jgi:predicted dehydrogenase
MTTTVAPAAESPGVAFLGGGFMSAVHSRAARAAGARLLGVASSSAGSAEAARDRLGLERSYRSVDALLEDPDVDVVHVCTPNGTHAELAAAVLAAGKDVVCEKPLATSTDAACRLVDLADASGRLAVVPFVYRFHPMVREARARIRSGHTGRLFSVQGSYLQDWMLDPGDDDWRVDIRHGGPSRAFADIGSHLCDLIEFVTGDRIARVNAQTRTVHPHRAVNRDIRTEDLAAVLFETSTGVVGTMLVSQVAAGRKNRLAFEISAERESLLFDQERPDELGVGRPEGMTTVARGFAGLSPAASAYSVVPAGHPQGYQDAFNALVRDAYLARQGREVDGLPVFADGLRAAVLTDAILRSREDGTWVGTATTPSHAGSP